ncbi:MAG: hypothetical protein ACXVA9_09335 [Bdellovibrionales bacterium]
MITKFVVLAVLVYGQMIFADTAFEKIYGAISGGGGKGVVCRSNGYPSIIMSARLLDLWEGQVLYDEQPLPVSGQLKADVEGILARLKNTYEFNGEGGVNNDPNTYKDQEYIFAYLREQAALFYGSNPAVLHLHGVTLALTDDSYEVARPADCEVEQIVNFQPSGRILINQDIFESMGPLDQAALIAHEALYSLLRNFAGETNSIRVRRSIGLAVSGFNFPLVPKPNQPQTVYCNSKNPRTKDFSIELYRIPTGDPNMDAFGIYPYIFDGSKIMGVYSWNYRFDIDKQSGFVDELLTGKCTGDGSASLGTRFKSYVEFDRDLNIVFQCENNVLSVFIKNSQIGVSSDELVPLKCTYP